MWKILQQVLYFFTLVKTLLSPDFAVTEADDDDGVLTGNYAWLQLCLIGHHSSF